MEIKEDFNLTNAVALWRQELLAQDEMLPGEIREMESHLHSSIDELEECGMGEDEPFWLAQRRLGPGEKIAIESTKAKPYRLWQNRLHWLTTGVLGAYGWATGLSFFSNGLALHGAASGGWWLAELVIFAILTGGLVWLATRRSRFCSRRLGEIFGSPWRMALGWFLSAAICAGIAWQTARLFYESSASMDCARLKRSPVQSDRWMFSSATRWVAAREARPCAKAA
jgi:hypothetical protein